MPSEESNEGFDFSFRFHHIRSVSVWRFVLDFNRLNYEVNLAIRGHFGDKCQKVKSTFGSAARNFLQSKDAAQWQNIINTSSKTERIIDRLFDL